MIADRGYINSVRQTDTTNAKGNQMNAKISKAILELVDSGMELKDAIDKVLGQGTFNEIVNTVYESLRK